MKAWALRSSWFVSIAAAVLTVTAVWFVLASGVIRDMDAFYHARAAAQLAARGPLEAIASLPFTSLAGDGFADQHFVYHLLLAVPIRLGMDPLRALALLTALLAGLAVGVFHAGIRLPAGREGARQVPYQWAFVALLLASTGFLYRAALGKASALAVALALAVFFLALERRPRTLVAICALWALSHGGWPLAIPVVGSVLVARYVHKGIVRADFEVIVAALGGLALGNLLHPNFPANLRFAWEQLVQIGVVGYGDVIEVGAEWSAPTFGMLWNGAGLAFLALAAAIGIRIRRCGGPLETRALAALLAAAGLLAMTLRSYRHVEYLVPFLLVAAAFVHADRRNGVILAEGSYPRFRGAGIQKKTKTKKASMVAFALLLVILVLRNVNGIRATIAANGVPPTRYQAVGAWLSSNAAPGDVVFHAAWDDFGPLWYHAPAQSYIVGLDPVFLYRHDPERYALWRHLSKGERSAPISGPLKNAFDARFVLIRPQDAALANAMVQDTEHFALVHEDLEAKLYELR